MGQACKGRGHRLRKKPGPSRYAGTGPKALRKNRPKTTSVEEPGYFLDFFFLVAFFLLLQPHVLHIVALLLNEQFGEPPTTRAAAPRALTLTHEYSIPAAEVKRMSC